MAIDPATVKALEATATAAAKGVAASAKGSAIRLKERPEIRFKKGFSDYLIALSERYQSVKTIVSSNNPVSLIDLYVNVFLANEKQTHRDDDFLEAVSKYQKIMFTAIAGSGKSMLMRYLFYRFLQQEIGRLPVFIDLRDLNHFPEEPFIQFLLGRIKSYIPSFTGYQLDYAFRNGHVILFLDGFDEIDFDKRPWRENEINSLAAQFRSLWIILSSRPDESFAKWEQFHVFKVQPFTKQQVELPIKKVPYDVEIKLLFQRKIAEGLYETHREFLINPLLTLMMLVTFGQNAEIPAKVHLFYEQAFDALFSKHDFTKGGFQRKRHTTLPLDDFKRLFSHFSMMTYLRRELTFTETSALELIQKSMSSSQIAVDKECFLRDLTECTCVLVHEGQEYTFSHRSFQEYFAAYFLSRVRGDEFTQIADRLAERATFDNVFLMIADMNREKFEEIWALPILRRLNQAVENIDASTRPVGYAEAIIGTLGAYISDNFIDLVIHTPNELTNLRFIIMKTYNVGVTRNAVSRERRRSKELIRKIKQGAVLTGDPRFNNLRLGIDARQSIVLSEADNSWVINTDTGEYFSHEKNELIDLLDAMEARVQARNDGLKAMLDLHA